MTSAYWKSSHSVTLYEDSSSSMNTKSSLNELMSHTRMLQTKRAKSICWNGRGKTMFFRFQLTNQLIASRSEPGYSRIMRIFSSITEFLLPLQTCLRLPSQQKIRKIPCCRATYRMKMISVRLHSHKRPLLQSANVLIMRRPCQDSH